MAAHVTRAGCGLFRSRVREDDTWCRRTAVYTGRADSGLAPF